MDSGRAEQKQSWRIQVQSGQEGYEEPVPAGESNFLSRHGAADWCVLDVQAFCNSLRAVCSGLVFPCDYVGRERRNNKHGPMQHEGCREFLRLATSVNRVLECRV